MKFIKNYIIIRFYSTNQPVAKPQQLRNRFYEINVVKHENR